MSKRNARLFAFLALVVGALGLAGLPEQGAPASADVDVLDPTPTLVRVPVRPVSTRPESVDLASLPNTCARLLVRRTDAGPVLRKERPRWLRSTRLRWREQQRIRELIRLVADEMGADATAAEVLWRMAIRESSGNAGAVHLLSADLEANRNAARRRRDSSMWEHARVAVWKRRGERLGLVGTVGAWRQGRGLYGQVTGLHAHRWPEAPPWSLCDPIVATVSVIWGMRSGLAECGGESLRDANRRFSSGRCEIRPARVERRFDRLARGDVRGLRLDRLDPDAPAVLGDRWPEESMTRQRRAELYARLSRRARAHGLI